MDSGVIPGGNALANLIQAGRNIGVRSVEDDQRFFAFFHRLPVWIRSRHMTSHYKLVCVLFDEDRNVSRKRNTVGVRNQNCERVCSHERESRGAIFLAVKFWYVHCLDLPVETTVAGIITTRASAHVQGCCGRIMPWP